MPYIKVNTNKLRNYSTELSSIKSKVSRIKSDFSSIASALDWDVKSASNIRSKTNSIVGDLGSEATSLSKMSSFLNSTSSTYTNLDEMKHNDNVSNGYTGTEIAVRSVDLTEDETDEIITQLSLESGVPKENILEDIKNGAEPAQKWLSKADEVMKKTEKWARFVTGATNLAFTMKNGKVILSGFTRSGVLNTLVKTFHNSVGIGTRYKPSTLLKIPVLGKLYAINQIAEGVNIAAGVAEGVVEILSIGSKIEAVLRDPSKTGEKRICDATAVGITSVASAALHVAAPIAGKAVTAAIPIPVLNVIAGMAVQGVISTVADVVTTEAVVNSVSDAVSKVGNAVKAGTKAVSDAGKALLESESVGEAIANTANLIGTAIVARTTVMTTAFVEGAKVAGTVVVETAKTIANGIVDTGKKVINWFKSW